jgi:hypothetical protein
MGSNPQDDTRPTALYGLLIGTKDPTAAPNLILYTAMRNDVIAGDLHGMQKVVEETLLHTPEEARRFFQSFLFCLQDYDEDPRELYQIAECRSWFQRIDKAYPFLIYFLPCHQYTLYVGSQHGHDGSRLSLLVLQSFFKKRERALQELAQRIHEPYQEMREKLRRAFWEYARLELEPW